MDPIRKSQPLPVTPPAPSSAQAKQVGEKFEAVFLTEMVNQMMSTVKVGNLDGGHAEETWRFFMAKAMADQIAKTGTTGIAQSVEHMLKAYGGRPGGTENG